MVMISVEYANMCINKLSTQLRAHRMFPVDNYIHWKVEVGRKLTFREQQCITYLFKMGIYCSGDGFTAPGNVAALTQMLAWYTARSTCLRGCPAPVGGGTLCSSSVWRVVAQPMVDFTSAFLVLIVSRAMCIKSPLSQYFAVVHGLLGVICWLFLSA
jgi:hypothetical protein